jgi:alkyldihydroxyacetonephosphate synthase
MRRWNGWGDSDIVVPIPPEGPAFLEAHAGSPRPVPDATLASCLEAVPPSRLPPHPLVSTDAPNRLRHARGQSLPDWIALRSGRIDCFPDGVAFPEDEGAVRSLLDYATAHAVALIPYGGGTSVVGHINPIPSEHPTLTVDLSRMSRLIGFDETSRLATFEAGVSGPAVERQLGALGFTLGHFPQSFEYSTLGGWIATRSTGQQSLSYGRIDELLAGVAVETPIGSLTLSAVPASAAGPDLRQLVLGSEGRLGVITRATVRVRPQPKREVFRAFFFHGWEEGIASLREAAQEGTRASMLRLSDPLETETTLVLSGRRRLAAIARRGLALAGFGPERCLLVAAETDDQSLGGLRLRQARSVGRIIGESWRRSRFLTPYLRNTLWEAGYALDTLETAVPWSEVAPCSAAILTALRDPGADDDEPTLAFAHLSHVYPDGASLYVTFLFARSADPDQTLERWSLRKGAATLALLAHGGTLSHQHGVGIDHRPYLERQTGETGLELLRGALRAADPAGILNPGKLVD